MALGLHEILIQILYCHWGEVKVSSKHIHDDDDDDGVRKK